MPAPSIKTLTTRLHLTPAQAKLVRKALKITKQQVEDYFYARTGLDDFPRLQKWLRECYNPPNVQEARMAAADEHAGTYGVEVLYRNESDRDDPRRGPAITYLNAGDTYRDTLISSGTNSYYVGAWGDWVERHPRAVV